MTLGMAVDEVHGAHRTVVYRRIIGPGRITEVWWCSNVHYKAPEILPERRTEKILPAIGFFQPDNPLRGMQNLAVLVDHVGQRRRAAEEPVGTVEVTGSGIAVVGKINPCQAGSQVARAVNNSRIGGV